MIVYTEATISAACTEIADNPTATCLSNNTVAEEVSNEFNFPYGTDNFYQYKHRSCVLARFTIVENSLS